MLRNHNKAHELESLWYAERNNLMALQIVLFTAIYIGHTHFME